MSTKEEDFELLKQLTEIQSCSGNESAIRSFIKDTVEDDCDRIDVDYLGNLICTISGNGKENDKLKVLLDAHMDEIGYIVRYIDDNGFIRFSKVGGQNPRIQPGQQVTIHSTSGEDIIGIIGEKPIHLIEDKERKKTSKFEDLFIDIGFSNKKEVEEYISVGDYITLKQEFTPFKNKNRFFSKSLDDRAGCFILIKLIKEFSRLSDKLDKDLIFLFAAQEEIGTRGATVGSYRVSPDLAIALEVTHAIDFPGISKDKFDDCSLGDGVAIRVGPNLYTKLSKMLVETAKENDIPYILRASPGPTPTDARAIQMTKQGIPCSLISAPLRYMHTNIETVEY
ncbi:MAG: M42 family peptidase, partial [Promethearchaeota archaeon]